MRHCLAVHFTSTLTPQQLSTQHSQGLYVQFTVTKCEQIRQNYVFVDSVEADTVYNTTVNVTCQLGYTFEEGSTHRETTCNEHAKWTDFGWCKGDCQIL